VADHGLDELATDEPVERALVLDDEDEHDDDEYWAIVSELQRRGDRETFEAARVLCLADSDDARCLGVAVLSQLGAAAGRPFLEASLPLVIGLCGEAASEDVVAACLHALGHLQDPRGAAAVLSQRTHSDATVRLAVAQAAEGVAGEPPDPAVVDAVVELTRDEDDAVRNWSTFSLALLFEVDDPVIRETLHARIGDDDAATAAEALAGLAARNDPRAAAALLARLQAAGKPPFPEQYVADVLVDAAEQLGDPRFIPALAMLREHAANPDAHARLTDAIATCAASS
jgi:HEAT repeat protein